MGIFGASKTSRLAAGLKQLQITMSAEPIKFATAVLDAVVPALGMEGDYPRLFSSGPPTSSTAPLNQMVLATEALSFFLHALSRISYRDKGEQLREAIFDPTVREMAHLFAEMTEAAIGPEAAEQLEPGNLEEEILQLVAHRESEFAQATALLGKDMDDPNSAISMAVDTICHSVHQETNILLKYSARTELLKCLVNMDLPSTVEQLEKFI